MISWKEFHGNGDIFTSMTPSINSLSLAVVILCSIVNTCSNLKQNNCLVMCILYLPIWVPSFVSISVLFSISFSYTLTALSFMTHCRVRILVAGGDLECGLQKHKTIVKLFKVYFLLILVLTNCHEMRHPFVFLRYLLMQSSLNLIQTDSPDWRNQGGQI